MSESIKPEDAPYQPASLDATEEVDRIATSLSESGTAIEPARSQAEADEAARHFQRIRDKDLDIELKKRVAYWALGAASIVVASSIIAFFLYLNTKRGDIAPEVMIAWLSATVVEVLGIVAIIARYLFPTGGNPPRE